MLTDEEVREAVNRLKAILRKHNVSKADIRAALFDMVDLVDYLLLMKEADSVAEKLNRMLPDVIKVSPKQMDQLLGGEKERGPSPYI